MKYATLCHSGIKLSCVRAKYSITTREEVPHPGVKSALRLHPDQAGTQVPTSKLAFKTLTRVEISYK
jgi:hypothetical protein